MRASRLHAGGWDGVGIGLSGLCAVHCLLMPLVPALLSLWPAAEAVAPWLHPLLAVPLAVVTAAAMQAGYRRHGSLAIVLMLGVGGLLVLVAALGHDVLGPSGETLTTLAGSGLLIVAHWYNGQAGCEH